MVRRWGDKMSPNCDNFPPREESTLPDREPILDPSSIDLDNVIANIEDIRECIPQRFEMEQLTAILIADMENRICVGYKDVSHSDFWVRGHMPGMPLMPGVMMCESAAQLAAYLVGKHRIFDDSVLGFAGLDEVHFRGMVQPGDRLLVMVKQLRFRSRAMITCQFQGFVRNEMVFEGKLKGVPLPQDRLAQNAADTP